MDVMDYTQNQTEDLNNVNQTVTQPEQSKIKKPINIDGYARKENENIFDYLERVGQDQIDLYNANVDRYAVKLRPEEYADINDLINVSSDPAEKEAEGYKIAAAMKYAKLYDIPLDEAYKNLESFNSSIFGNEPVQYNKGFWTSLVDSLTLGQNTVDMGMIGGQIREATERGDAERVAQLTDLYRKYQAQNENLAKNLPQNLAMKIVEAGAQSLPFTMGAIGMSVVSPVTGFTFSAGVMAGEEYMDLTESGASHETASAVSTIVGTINGIVEVELGNVAGALGARASGTKAGELLRKGVIDKITKSVAEKMHYSGGWRVIANVLGRNILENFEEGCEEATQQTFSLLGKHIANELDDLGIENMTAKEIAQDLSENFWGGVYGSILLGSGTLVKNSIAAKADYDAVKQAAEVIPSEKSFTKAVINSPVFEEMDEETKAKTAHEIYQKFGNKRDEALTRKADSLSEVISADEGMENYEPEVDENGNVLEVTDIPAEVRDENGRLYSQQENLTENADGTYSGKKVYGDATKQENNQYGYISYTINEEDGTVTIDDFKTNEYRQYLNNEMFADFASEMSDYDIVWNPSLEDAKKWKSDIEALNPRGKENGLNYFSTKNQTEIEKKDQQTRQRLVRELSQKFNLNGEEKALAVAMIEAMAKSEDGNLSTWVEKYFSDEIMGNIEDLKEAARQESIKQGKEITATGGMTLKETAKGVKAIIYAAEGADLSTALHEFSHVWTMGLSGDLLSEAADVFGAIQNKDGTYDWNAPVTLANGKTVSAYENLAYSYEKWLETGKAPTPQHENIFKKFAEFMKNCVKTLRSAVKLTPETEDFFNKYFNVSEGMLKNAENAVIAETENTASSENITKSGENITESEEALSDKEIEALLNDFNNEELQNLVDAGLVSEETAKAVKETKLDPVTQEAVASILDDPEIPADKKVAAVMKANGEVFQDKQDNIEYYRNREDLTEEQKQQAVKDLEENNDTNENGTGFPWSLVNKTPKDMLFQEEEDFLNSLSEEDKKVLNSVPLKNIDAIFNKVFSTLEKWGLNPEEKSSNLSGSKYISLFNEEGNNIEIRISDHDLPVTYDNMYKPTYDIKAGENTERNGTAGNASHYYYVLSEIADKFNKSLDKAEKNLIRKDEINYELSEIRKNENKAEEFDYKKAREDIKKNDPELYSLILERDKKASENSGEKRRKINKKTNKIIKDYFQINTDAIKERRAQLLEETEDVPRNAQIVLFQEAGPVESENFKKWFKDSKVVDEEGKPLIVYHGSYADFDVFDRTKTRANMDIQGNFFSPWELDAQGYGPNVRAFYLSIQNPADSGTAYAALNKFKGQNEAGIKAREYLISKGYDGVNNDNEEYIAFYPEQIKSATNNNGDFSSSNPSILLQTAYHGSGADFDKFDTETYGLSGEGSMSFGYGTYVSGSKDIAKDYAERQRPESDLPIMYKGKEANYTERNAYIRLKQANFDIDVAKYIIWDDIGWAEDKIKNGGDKAWYDDYIAEDKKQLELLESSDFDIKDFENPDTNAKLYTVEIPDDGFMQWDQNVSSKVVEEILKTNPYLYTLKRLLDNYEQYKDNPNSTYLYGSNVYKALSKELRGGDKAASRFLYNMGYKGIEYPAGTIYGNGEGARNFVIFNDEDAKIIGKTLFQNEINDDVMNTAAGFDNWVEFMEYVQNVEPEMAPEEAASDWYLNTWEIAHNVSPTSAEREADMNAQREAQNEQKKDPVFLDGLFMHEIQKDKNLENFLKLVNKVSEITDEEINQLEEDERGYILNELKKIETVLSHPTIEMARKALLKSDELKPAHKQRVINLIRGRIRDYRAVFADVTGRTEYSVEQSESLDAELASRARRFNLIRYDSEVEDMSPEQKRALEKYVTDKEILKKFRDDKVKMDDPDVERYIEMLEGQLKTAEKNLKDARSEFQSDMESLGSMQMRDILRQYNEFLNFKSEADYKNVSLPAGSTNALKLGEKAQRQQQTGMKQNYNTLAANWDNFKKEVEANVRIQERLRAEGKLKELEDKIKYKYDAKRMAMMLSKVEALNAMNKEYGDKRRELVATRQLKDLRKTLVKRVMRRVNFSSVDYDQAKNIIAIQKVFEPNLRGGINKWIGTENQLAREIWSAWNTDEIAKEKMLERLSNKGKTDLIKLLEDTKDIVDFEKWTSKEKKALEKAMPRQNWIKDLNLDVWKDERDNALQLPIKEVVRYETKLEPNGTKRQIPYPAVEITPEIERLLVESIGEDLAYAINNRHFEDWTTGEMEELAKRISELFKQGRDKLNAKRKAERLEADRIRNLIDQTIKDTGIVIEPDDPEDVKKAKQEKIDKILGVQHAFPGTEASRRQKTQVQTWLDRLLHGYHDANIRRVARILDNYDEGTATNLLYFRENDCFNKKARAVDRRNAKLDKVIADNKLDMRKLGNVVQFFGQDFTVDEILMFHAANMNQADFYAEQLLEDPELEPSKAEKESAYQAVMYGNLVLQEERDRFRKIDQKILEAEQERLDKLHAAELAGNQEEIDKYKVRDSNTVDVDGELLLAGTMELKALAESRFQTIISGTQDILNEFKPLIDAIRADYAAEFDNINRVSIEEFNAPVWREKWYLPLIRQTFGGDTHEERVKQDLLGHSAGAGKAGTEKGFTKKRVKIGPLNQAPVELGLYKTWADSVDRNEHFVAYAGLVREYNRVFDSRDSLGMMQDLENRYGHAMYDYIKSYIKEVANPRISTPQKGLDKVMHIMRGNTAPAYLGWKFSSILKQGIESPAPFMQFVNPVEYMHAAMRMATSKDVRDGIESKSAFMKSRVFDPMVDLINENVEKSMNKPNYLLKKFQQAGMSGLEWIDWACVAPGWLAVYDKEYNRLQAMEQALYEARVEELWKQNDTRSQKYRMTAEEIHQQAMEDVSKDIEEAAVLKADDCVRLCQPSNRNVDLAPMFKNNSEAAKAVLQFQTALNVIWQNIRYDIPYAMRKKEWKHIIGMILGYVMAGVVSGVVCSGLLKDDDEPEDTAKRIGFYSTTQFLDSFPIVGGNLERLAEKAITGEGGPMFGSSLWPTFDKYYNAVNSFLSKDYEKSLKNVAQGLAITFGFPLSGTKEALRAVGLDDGDGEIELNPKALAGRRD